MLITTTCFRFFVQNVGNRAPYGHPYQDGTGRGQRQASQNGLQGVQEGCGGSRGKVCPHLQGSVSGDFTLTLIQHIVGRQRYLRIVPPLCSILLLIILHCYSYSNECGCFCYHSEQQYLERNYVSVTCTTAAATVSSMPTAIYYCTANTSTVTYYFIPLQ